MIGVSRLRIQTECLAVIGDGLVILVKIDPGEATVTVEAVIFRIKLDGLAVVGDRLRVLALVSPGKAAVVVDDCGLGIELEPPH